jgi:hypothetical protein
LKILLANGVGSSKREHHGWLFQHRFCTEICVATFLNNNCCSPKRVNVAKDKNAGKEEEVADVVLTTIEAEEASYMMCKPCNVTYSLYTDRKGNTCLTCQGCETWDVKGWCGKVLCSVPANGGNDKNSHSLDDSDSSVPALLKRKDDWSDNDSDNNAYQDDTQGQDMALVTNDSSSELLDYLCQVTIKIDISEPNVDYWANSVKTKLKEIQMKTSKDVVSNIIALNWPLPKP